MMCVGTFFSFFQTIVKANEAPFTVHIAVLVKRVDAVEKHDLLKSSTGQTSKHAGGNFVLFVGENHAAVLALTALKTHQPRLTSVVEKI